MKKRLLAWNQENAVASIKRAFSAAPAPQMLEAEHVLKLTAQIKAEDVTIALVIVDTLATSFVGGDENTSKDMGAFINTCRKLRSAARRTDLAAVFTTLVRTSARKNAAAAHFVVRLT